MANAKLTPSTARQYPLVAEVAFDYTQVADTGVAVPAIKLPPNAQVVGGAVVVDTAFNLVGTGPTYTLNVGDALVATRYANAANLMAAGRTALTLTGYVGDGGDIRITPTVGGTGLTMPTQGKGRVLVEYVIDGRTHEVQPS